MPAAPTDAVLNGAAVNGATSSSNGAANGSHSHDAGSVPRPRPLASEGAAVGEPAQPQQSNASVASASEPNPSSQGGIAGAFLNIAGTAAAGDEDSDASGFGGDDMDSIGDDEH